MLLLNCKGEKMSKLFTKKSFFAILSVLMIVLFAFSFMPTLTYAENENDNVQVLSDNQDLIIEIYNRDGGLILDSSTTTYGENTAYLVNWEDVQEFRIYYDPTSDVVPQPIYEEDDEILPENEVYNLSIDVEYFQNYYDSNSLWAANRQIIENVYARTEKGQNSYKNLKLYKHSFNIDDGVTGTYQNNSVTFKDWGIYRWTVTVNNLTFVSDFYIVQPTLMVSERPTIDYEITSSNLSLSDSFRFFLTNADDYRYVDEASLIWYVKGEGTDGTLYALTESDLRSGNANFTDCTASIVPEGEIDRTGTEFNFDPAMAGKWDVWCEFQAHNSGAVTSDRTINVETKAPFDVNIILWICLAVILAIVIAITIYSALRPKKDKVW